MPAHRPALPQRPRRFQPEGPFGLPLTLVERGRMVVIGGTWTMIASFVSLLAYDALRPAIAYPPPIVAVAAPIPNEVLAPPEADLPRD